MVRREDLLSFTRADPFRPFVVILTGGERYEIRYPDMIAPSLGMAAIGVPAPGGDAADTVTHVPLTRVLKLEHLGPPG